MCVFPFLPPSRSRSCYIYASQRQTVRHLAFHCLANLLTDAQHSFYLSSLPHIYIYIYWAARFSVITLQTIYCFRRKMTCHFTSTSHSLLTVIFWLGVLLSAQYGHIWECFKQWRFTHICIYLLLFFLSRWLEKKTCGVYLLIRTKFVQKERKSEMMYPTFCECCVSVAINTRGFEFNKNILHLCNILQVAVEHLLSSVLNE